MRTSPGRRMRWVAAVLLLLTVAGLLAGPAWATELRSGNTVVIEQGETINDDLFVSGSTVIVNGTVNGDLWAAGNLVQVNGRVSGSTFLAGQSLTVSGRLAGSLYAGGATLLVSRQAVVGRNLYFAGASLTAEPGSTVGRDVYATGGQAVLNGAVARQVGFAGSGLEINGSVGGDVRASVAAPGEATRAPWTPAPIAPGLRVGPGARIGGQLVYTSPVEQSQNIRSRPAGGVVYRPAPEGRMAPTGAAGWALGWLRDLVTLLALGALAVWGLRAPFGRLAGQVWQRPLIALAWGILILLAGYFAAFVSILLILLVALLLALLTLGGLALAVLSVAGGAWFLGLALFQLAVAYGGRLVVAYLLGEIVLVRLARRPGVRRVWILVVGVLILSLISSIPVVGGFLGFLATLFGLGAIYLVWRESRQRRPAGA